MAAQKTLHLRRGTRERERASGSLVPTVSFPSAPGGYTGMGYIARGVERERERPFLIVRPSYCTLFPVCPGTKSLSSTVLHALLACCLVALAVE